MSRIIDYLKDPVWWFTAIFIAIIVSIFAGFLKDVVGKLLSMMFRSYAEKKKQRDDAFHKEVENMTRDHTFILMYISRFIIVAIVTACLVTMFMIFYAALLVISIDDPTDSISNSFIKTTITIWTFFVGTITLFVFRKLHPFLRMIRAVYFKYRKELRDQQDQSQDSGDKQ